MIKQIPGVIHGTTIELEESPGLTDGMEIEVILLPRRVEAEAGRKVEVIVRSRALPGPPPGWRPGGKETAAGMMAGHWTEDDDRILEEIERDRHRPSTRKIPE